MLWPGKRFSFAFYRYVGFVEGAVALTMIVVPLTRCCRAGFDLGELLFGVVLLSLSVVCVRYGWQGFAK